MRERAEFDRKLSYIRENLASSESECHGVEAVLAHARGVTPPPPTPNPRKMLKSFILSFSGKLRASHPLGVPGS